MYLFTILSLLCCVISRNVTKGGSKEPRNVMMHYAAKNCANSINVVWAPTQKNGKNLTLMKYRAQKRGSATTMRAASVRPV